MGMIDKDDAIKAVCEACYMYKYIGDEYKECRYYPCDDVKALEAIPSAEAEQVTGKLDSPCGSLVTGDSDTCKESGNKLDLISRASAMGIVEAAISYENISARASLYMARAELSALPSAVCDDCIWHVCNYNKIDWDALSAEAVQGWIPCSERLPKVGENVLFTTDIYGGYVAEGDRRADGKWWQYRWNALLQNDEVTAWMPLPKPYKGGEDE